MKKLAIITLCVALLITMFTGCSSTPTDTGNGDKTSEKQIPDLMGEWKQSNSKSEDSYQAATISDNTIEIYWVSDNGDTKSLYWAGSFVAPTTADEPYKWDSENDHSKTDSAMLASSDDTKTMTYQNGILSYEASAMGTTTTVKLEKQSNVSVSSTESSSQPTIKEESKPQTAAEVLSSSATVWENSIGSVWIMGIAELKNAGSTPLYLSSGTFDYEDESGKLIKSSSMVSVYPEVILPGESAFYFETTTLDEVSDVSNTIKLIPHTDYKEAKVDQILFPTSEVEIKDDTYGGIKAIGRVENTTSEDESLVYVAVLIRNKEGAPLCALMTIVDVKAGAKMGFEANALSLPDNITAADIGDFTVFAYPMQMQF